MNTRILTAALLAGTVGLAGCKTKAPEQLPPPPMTNVNPPSVSPMPPPGPMVGSQEHFVNAVNGQNVIYFDTDRFNVDSVDAAALQTQAQYLQQHPGLTAAIEGHADERGTRDYNLALGERRANSAKNYLVGLGIPASRLRTVSYGKERPVAMGSNAQAWAQNRRAVTVVIR